MHAEGLFNTNIACTKAPASETIVKGFSQFSELVKEQIRETPVKGLNEKKMLMKINVIILLAAIKNICTTYFQKIKILSIPYTILSATSTTDIC